VKQERRGRDRKETPKYLGRKGREVLKEGETEQSADSSAASDLKGGGGRICINPLHLPLEEVLPIEDNICRLRRDP
jgi:hypothetical protein